MMKRFNGGHWADYIEKLVRPDFEGFGDVTLKRILPVFDNINQEAQDEANKAYKEMMSSVVLHEDWDDGGAIAELAMEKGYEHHSLLWAMQCATLNLYSAALYHLFEQHVIDLSLEIIDHRGTDEVKPKDAINFLRDGVGADIRSFPSWQLVDELRLVANTIKHGEGHSAEELHHRRPNLFQNPFLKGGHGSTFRMRVRKPLFGEDMFVTADDFQKYHAATVSQWTETAAEFRRLTR